MRSYLLFIMIHLDRWLSSMQSLLCQVSSFCCHVPNSDKPICLLSGAYRRLLTIVQSLVTCFYKISVIPRYHPIQLAPQVRTHDHTSSFSVNVANKLNLARQILGSTSHFSNFTLCWKFHVITFLVLCQALCINKTLLLTLPLLQFVIPAWLILKHCIG